ncbi:sigma-70 family RNA polymerase sigma factor [Paenibacillus tritici]|uniref:Sigma-70 family RNA polymerase sigma factor n=1 Tax=Paenibacillus tritici TaxID=1873425 RepID=A0ABX2DY76_9BACL|nr:sigma-70 family RNA polymerase sigma factor [Paenibacillus tritici]NQX49680.1 sigma-70 family RNA polymerase sigma factor [Paenibacillus tritici]QUL56443.1 sigma-70 family RNA polymerase sigma factor [Paenibacillus tritici]
MNISRLVRAAQRGNKEALLELILAEQDAYYRLAYSYMKNEHDAMDVMEDMIVTLYEKLEQLKKREAFYSWSKTILVNRCKAVLRSQNRFVALEEDGPPEPALEAWTADNPYRYTESELDMSLLLAHLNPRQREAIELRYVHDLSYQTIADITDAPVGTIKSRISQGIQKLKAMIGGDRYENDRGETTGASADQDAIRT